MGNTVTRTAQALTTIATSGDEARIAAIADLVSQWQPNLLVVGVPVHADGTPHAMTARARRFARSLRDRFGLDVHEADERHTTRLAQSALAGSGRRGRAARDEVAAELILQGWFDEGAAAT